MPNYVRTTALALLLLFLSAFAPAEAINLKITGSLGVAISDRPDLARASATDGSRSNLVSAHGSLPTTDLDSAVGAETGHVALNFRESESGVADPRGFATGSARAGGGHSGRDVAVALTTAYAGLSGGDRLILSNSCQSILLNPSAFDAGLVAICRLMVLMGQLN